MLHHGSFCVFNAFQLKFERYLCVFCQLPLLFCCKFQLFCHCRFSFCQFSLPCHCRFPFCRFSFPCHCRFPFCQFPLFCRFSYRSFELEIPGKICSNGLRSSRKLWSEVSKTIRQRLDGMILQKQSCP